MTVSVTNPWYPLLVMLDDANIPGDTPEEQVRNLIAEVARLERQLTAASRQTDHERLLATLDEDRSQTLFLLHDACIDAQRDQEAQGWGWLATRRRWPTQTRQGWSWVSVLTSEEQEVCHFLPLALMAVMEPKPSPAEMETRYPRIDYPTPRAALQAVVDVIAAGKWTVGAKPRTPQGTFLPYREE